jgi:hypothetical protein
MEPMPPGPPQNSPHRHQMKRLLLLSLVALAGCGQPAVSTVAATIGVSGGTLTSSDGIVTLTIPAGALVAPTKISIGAAQGVPADAQMVGKAYQIDPAGTPLAVAASLAMGNRVQAGNLAIAALLDGQWVPLASQVDSMHVTAEIDGLAPCALVAIRPGSGSDGAAGAGGGAGTGGAGGEGARGGAGGGDPGGAGGGDPGGAGGGDPGGAGGGAGFAGAGGGAGAPFDASVDRDAAGSGGDASDGAGADGNDGSGVGGVRGAGGTPPGGADAGGTSGTGQGGAGAGADASAGSGGSPGSSADGSLD